MCYNFESENKDKDEIFTILTTNKKLLRELTINLIPISHFIGISEGTTYCPFHQDKSHKSAKVYEDVDGISRLYCFGQCQTQYTSYDYIWKILRKSPMSILFKEFPMQKLLEFINNYVEKPFVDNAKTLYVQEKFNLSGGDLIKFIDLVYLD